ncbi:JAB domain-containing protein [Chitinimonas koreensis]|uniref:JAB domain-containing protein n=1 Tax=Chitinimonas koreensis TaxID=356302 RepID=UPI00048B1C8F|nr:DNA repair protein RadC [Chitinimonas koreensis]QNM96705.1 DNA repair protein RadC [Chitinimonas koreensis]
MSYIAADSGAGPLALLAAQNKSWLVQHAISLLEEEVFRGGPVLGSPSAVRDYLRLKLVTEPNEVFSVVFLSNKHHVLACEALFRGTVNSTVVYPRVVVQRALVLNAAAVIFAHQHPSGCTEPSSADHEITGRLRTALGSVDIKVLDHFIIGKGDPYSFAEAGLL